MDYLLPGPVFFGNLSSNGALAQLGERLHGMQEVEGSNPLGSIEKSLADIYQAPEMDRAIK